MKSKINKSDLKRFRELNNKRKKYIICESCFMKTIQLLEEEEIEKQFGFQNKCVNARKSEVKE